MYPSTAVGQRHSSVVTQESQEPLIPALWRQRLEDLCEAQASLVCRVRSRPARATQRNLLKGRKKHAYYFPLYWSVLLYSKILGQQDWLNRQRSLLPSLTAWIQSPEPTWWLLQVVRLWHNMTSTALKDRRLRSLPLSLSPALMSLLRAARTIGFFWISKYLAYGSCNVSWVSFPMKYCVPTFATAEMPQWEYIWKWRWLAPRSQALPFVLWVSELRCYQQCMISQFKHYG